MYVGANNGGVWKTTNWSDSSPTWTEITDKPQILSLAVHEHDLVVFPGNPKSCSRPRRDRAAASSVRKTRQHLELPRQLAIRSGRNRRPRRRSERRQCPDVLCRNQRRLSQPRLGAPACTSRLTAARPGPTQAPRVFRFRQRSPGNPGGRPNRALRRRPGNGQPNSGAIYRSADGGANWTPYESSDKPHRLHSIRLPAVPRPPSKFTPRPSSLSRRRRLPVYPRRTGRNWSQLNWPDAPAPARAIDLSGTTCSRSILRLQRRLCQH